MHSPHYRTRTICLFALLAIGALLPADPLDAAPVISEFMAINNRTRTDEDGAASDFIEIRNVGAAATNLAGYRLTDEPGNLSKWVFPSRTMNGGAFLVVFASGKNRTPAVGELHTNFSLNGNGEYLALVDPSGTVVTEFNPFPQQYEDISFGSSAAITTQKVLASSAPCRWLVPTAPVNNWQSELFPDSSWTLGTTAVGYDLDVEYTALLGANSNVQAQMYNLRTSVYMRVPFTIPSVQNLIGVRLRMKYDDGFQAFLNGTAAAAGNVTLPLQWDSSTLNFHPDADALVFETFIANDALGALHAGTNVLAIQGVNQIPNSSDLLFMPEIELDFQDAAAPPVIGYMPMPTPGAANTTTYLGFVKDTKFSVDRGFFSAPFNVEVTSLTTDAQIRYTTNGSEPTEITGTLYTGPIPITTTTVLRAVAFKAGYVSTNVDTQTYIFAAAVKNQPANPAGYPAQWGAPGTPAPPTADYAMDQGVVTSPDYSGVIETALKSTLPVVCISTPIDNLFAPDAIYADGNFGSEEIPISLEYFDPNGTDAFQQNSGLRIHGGNARSHPKKPFRLYFRRDYGKGKLDFPLFPDSPVDSFDQLILRPGGHDGWSVPFGSLTTDLAFHATYMRDQFMRRTENDMGLLSPHGKYVHVYINGLYWGVYDLHERPNAQYFASHLGGNEEDWDVVHHPSFVGERFTVVDGQATAYTALQDLAKNGISTPAEYAAIQQYIDIDDYIDSMITRMWAGDYDWDGQMFLKNLSNLSQEAEVTYFTNKNWYGGRKSRNGEGKFHFFTWDAEMCMGSHLMANLNSSPLGTPAWFGTFPPLRIPNFDSTRAGTDGAPAFPYSALRNYAPFRIRFGDRLHKHFFNNGKMTAAANLARLTSLESILQTPIVAESARWGDVNRNSPANIAFTRKDHWQPEVNWLKNEFIATRTATVLEQFRAIGLYPNAEAATASNNGGPVPTGTQITLTAPPGSEIYYTLDGSDPYIPAQTETLTIVADNATVRTLIPSVANGGANLAGTWRGANEPFNTTGWTVGTQGVGYETAGVDYAPFINANVGAMQNVNGSVFVRITYPLTSQSVIDSIKTLTLRVRYDDGFVAYMRGTEVARRNSPSGIPTWDALSSTFHDDLDAVVYESIDITPFKSEIRRSGANVLSFHVMNQALNSSDLLLQAQLVATRDLVAAMPSPTAILYSGTPITLTSTSVLRSRALNTATGEWSALNEAQYLVGSLAAPGNIVVSEFLYRPREPIAAAETSISTNRDDFEFIELVNISGGTIDLTDMHFSQGITFNFTGGTLAPGQKVLVVRNRAAFLARYGVALDAQIAGEFENGTGLSNGGERITLLDALGQTIHTFVYNDAAPWPTAPDDYGHSLVLANPAAAPDHNNPANWMASLDPGGTPGNFIIASYDDWRRIYFDPLSPDFATDSHPMTDIEGDGLANFIEYTLLTDPFLADIPAGSNPPAYSFVTDPGGMYMALTFRQRPPTGDFTCGAETASNLTNWEANTTEVGTAITNPDGSLTRTFRSNAPMNGATPNAQMRVTATSTP